MLLMERTLECIVMELGVVTQKYKHLRHCSILQYILIVRHFRGWTRFGSYEMYGITSNPNVPGLYIKYVGDNHFQVVKSIA